MQRIHLKINNRALDCVPGTSILEAAQSVGIYIPTLCYLKEKKQGSICGICMVEDADGKMKLACTTEVVEDMEVYTDTWKVKELRKKALNRLAQQHRMDCESCTAYRNCEFHRLLRENGIDDRAYQMIYREADKKIFFESLEKDYSKCVKCSRCVRICENNAMVLSHGTIIMNASNCIGCGKCLEVCPTGALTSIENPDAIWKILLQKKKIIFMKLSREILPLIEKEFGTYADSERRMTDILKKMGIQNVIWVDHDEQCEQIEMHENKKDYCVAVVKNPGIKMQIGKKYDLVLLTQGIIEWIYSGSVSRYTAMQLWENTLTL